MKPITAHSTPWQMQRSAGANTMTVEGGPRVSMTTHSWPAPSRSLSQTLLLVAVLPLLTQLVGSVFNIWYNSFHVTPFLTATEEGIFRSAILVFNLGIYPIGLAVWVAAVASLYRPLVQLERGEDLDERQLEKAA